MLVLCVFSGTGRGHRHFFRSHARPDVKSCSSVECVEVWGGIIWALGVGGESVADFQLNRFRRNPNNRGKPAGRGYGDIPAIPITFLRACTGVPMWS